MGLLKVKGVNLVYDVSFGADITTWAYPKIIKERKSDSMISQPFPVVVNYIERYKPELISRHLNHIRKSVEKITAAMNEIVDGGEEVGRNLNEILGSSAKVMKVSCELKDITKELKQGMYIFINASKEIIMIADQTNILSLNASIDAVGQANTEEALRWLPYSGN